jgi:hypothetical protein
LFDEMAETPGFAFWVVRFCNSDITDGTSELNR